MAMSLSRPDPSSPTAVSTATFSTTRRGFDPGEVRDFLRMVAAELARLQEREKHLERELRSAQRATPNAAVALDEEVVTRMLGEEAARILSTAREAASQIKVRAEESSSRLLREATDEAQRLREEAEIEAARRRQDASADAEAELEMAKQQGREMVNEARAYRERVLGELARRRELARQQIEQLVHGRDRLLQAFERARLAAVDVMAELTPLNAPNEYVNLAPTTGPVPLMVPATPPPAPPAAPAPAVAPPEPEIVEVETAEAAEEAAITEETVVIEEAVEEAIEEEAVEAPDVEVGAEPEAEEDAEQEEPDDRPIAPVVALFAGEPVIHPEAEHGAEVDAVVPEEAVVEEAGAEPESSPLPPSAPKSSVDDLFARLRASRTDAVVERARADEAPGGSHDAGEPAVVVPIVSDETKQLAVFQPSPAAPVVEEEVDDSPFGRRDAALTPLIIAGARKLKRVLADEQNDVLHALRRADAARSLDSLLLRSADHVERYAHAIDDELRHAALAGAASVDDREAATHEREIVKHRALQPAVEALAASLVEPLRERVDRAVGQAGGDAGELSAGVRAIYREWKTQRIDEHLDDVVRTAFGRGALVAVLPGTPVSWAVDPRATVCPDCDDNVLAGVVPAGQQFPTGHLAAPAHSGCRCMLVRVPR